MLKDRVFAKLISKKILDLELTPRSIVQLQMTKQAANGKEGDVDDDKRSLRKIQSFSGHAALL